MRTDNRNSTRAAKARDLARVCFFVAGASDGSHLLFTLHVGARKSAAPAGRLWLACGDRAIVVEVKKNLNIDQARRLLIATCLAAFLGSALMVLYLTLTPDSKLLLVLSGLSSATSCVCAFWVLGTRRPQRRS